PIAINVRDLDFGIGISLPTEPLMFGVLIFFIIKILYEGKYDIRILKHPVTISILLFLIWILFTSITSEMPVVSFKFLLSRLWFIIPFYFLAVLLFKEFGNTKLFIWLYVISFSAVIIYTLYNHALRGFDEESGHWVMTPFYNDHTAYGAILAMFVPVLLGFGINKKHGFAVKIVSIAFFVLFSFALIFSYSRAAWLSFAAATGVFILIYLKIKFRWVLLSMILIISFFYVFQEQIIDKLEQNKQDSSANFVEHVQSISNISSNTSNLERINRWQSAIRMFQERPFWGWGPGTYQFLYAPFQRSKEKTIISTNVGDMGNAHSEYIGPLAESGIFGLMSVIFIVISVIYTGIKVYRRADDKEIKVLSLVVVIGLVTYFIHGLLNNFLDSDKASVPVWGFIAIIVALDLYHNNKREINT
ncbi:MAG: O-antigen ligase family protein, partial [Bacteroidales bacterium]|nr:O-antigen ligase family protein [Bacteroidales bacterium]